jgi:predicted Rossmann fold flavoprotein
MKQNEVLEELNKQLGSGKQVGNTPLFEIKSRLWAYLLDKAGIKAEATWKSLNPKNLNKLTEVLTNSFFHMQGKTTFKEEFVTAGGVDLNFVDVNTMEHKQIPGLFFAGEVLDIDGITGGFNFQSAWTTAFIAGNAVRINEKL